jgi:polysaccharide deacetylase 2 family uncharacterized protein YibQ
VPTRRKSRRRKRSPAFALLFLLGLGCCFAAAALWLWSPDRAPQTAADPTPPPAAPPDIPTQRQVAVATEPAEPEPTIAAATVAPATAAPVTAAPVTAAPATVAPVTPAPDITKPPASAAPAAALATGAPLPSTGGRPRLAIIIDDCGQWPDTERAFVALPFPLTLSVLPHVRFGSAIARDASAAGKGVMLHLPMQTISGRYPGPGTITTSMPDDAIRSELTTDLAELPQARGVNNHEGSLATQDPRVMGDIADVLAHDGRFFIDSRTSSASVGESVARGRGVPSAARSVFLDNVDDEAAVEARLREAVRDALATGSAIAIGHPRPATLAAVRTLGPTFAADGVELTLASALVH